MSGSVPLSSPLDLRRHLQEPRGGVDMVPLVDVLLIGLCLLLMGSGFIGAPGVGIALPEVHDRQVVPVTEVLTIKHDRMLLFRGRIFTVEELRHFFEKEGVKVQGGALLVKVDREVSVQALLNVCEVVRQSGFERIQLATVQRALVEPWAAAL